LLAGLIVLMRGRRVQHECLSARLRAERVKSEFFVFLAREGGYATDDRVARLMEQIDEIEMAEDTT
jgi:hypothetical protein